MSSPRSYVDWSRWLTSCGVGSFHVHLRSITLALDPYISTPNFLRKTSPFLLTAVCASASNFLPAGNAGLTLRLYNHFDKVRSSRLSREEEFLTLLFSSPTSSKSAGTAPSRLFMATHWEQGGLDQPRTSRKRRAGHTTPTPRQSRSSSVSTPRS